MERIRAQDQLIDPCAKDLAIRELNLEPAMSKGTVLMEAELREAPQVVARQSELLARPLCELAIRLRHDAARCGCNLCAGQLCACCQLRKISNRASPWYSCRRGCSEHHDDLSTGLRLKRQLFLTISQSGRSDDLVEAASSGADLVVPSQQPS